MRHVLALIGSPRKGETYKAVQRLEEEMKKHGPVEFEYVMLRDLNLQDCLGCHACFMKGQEFCPEAAKVKAMQEKMMAADAVVLASPAYNQGITAILKKFLDYYTFLWHRPALFGVKFFGVATGGGVFGGIFKAMKTNAESWGGTWAGSLGVPHYESLTRKYRAKQDRDFVKKAALLTKAMDLRGLPRPTFGRLMWFRMWRMNASLGFCPKDREHWAQAGWLNPKRSYFYDTKANPLKNAAAAAAMGVARRVMRGIYEGY